MPRLDGTGPEGKGPKTGRRLGNCDQRVKEEENNDLQKSKTLGFGRGFGRGCGRGFGRGRRSGMGRRNW